MEESAGAHEKFKQRLMRQLLTRKFGFTSFRPGQDRLISAILDGRDVLGVLPTGAGKSLCYELPALMLPGLTIVVTPLISLMQDQVRRLSTVGIPAASVNSTQTPGEERAVLDATSRAQNRLLYVAPERLSTPLFQSFARRVPVTILAVDEAHCVSQWGQDFRPAYLRIPEFVEALPRRPVLAAFTATATPKTRADIASRLRLQNPLSLTTSFDRPNLTWHVCELEARGERTEAVVGWALSHKGEPGIVYCSTRRGVDALSATLARAGLPALPYHAGLDEKTRRDNQAAFLSGRASIIVATSAFGMGIDKPNVRWVLHNNAPQSLEEYYQEAGRAGRDGQPADCILLWGEGDFRMGRRFIRQAGENNDELSPADRRAVRRHLTALLEAMHSYCLTTKCLRNTILGYFGEHKSAPCGKCDNCLLTRKGAPTRDAATLARGVCQVVGESRRRLPYSLGAGKVIAIALGAGVPGLEKTDVGQWDSYGVLSGMPSADPRQAPRLLRRVVSRLLALGVLKEGRYSTLQPGPRFQKAGSPSFTLTLRDNPEGRRPLSPALAGRGVPRLSSEGAPALRAAGAATRPPSRKGGDADADQALYERLRRLRLALARKRGVPAFRVFTNRALRNMVLARPTSMGELLKVAGVGQVGARKYGKQFLNALGGD